MRFQFQKSIYTIVPGGDMLASCRGCAFLDQDENLCVAIVPIYKKLCPPPGKVLQYTDVFPEVFDL